MFPLHCNKCFSQKELDISTQFFLSNCGHVLCDQCVVNTNCPLCNRPYKPIMIGKSMPNSMAAYFEPPLNAFKHFQKQWKFQCEQEAIFANYHINELPKLMRLAQRQLNGYVKLDQRMDELLEAEKKRIAKLKEYLAYHERLDEYPNNLHPHTMDPRRGRRSSVDSHSSTLQPVRNSQKFYRPETPTLSLPDSSIDEKNVENPDKPNTDFTM